MVRLPSNFTDLIGIIKDTASLARAALTSKPRTLALHFAVLVATSHDPLVPPCPKQVALLLSSSDRTCFDAAITVEIIINRLHSTRNSYVAVKCLFVMHYLIRNGSGYLREKVSNYVSSGRRNCFNMSNFRDTSTPFRWEISSWVKWYARYLETLLPTYEVLGFFQSAASITQHHNDRPVSISTMDNSELLHQINTCVQWLAEICDRPDRLHTQNNNLLDEITALIDQDFFLANSNMFSRVSELNARFIAMKPAVAVRFLHALQGLEDRKERMMSLTIRKKILVQHICNLIGEIKCKSVASKRCMRSNIQIALSERRLDNLSLYRYLPSVRSVESCCVN